MTHLPVAIQPCAVHPHGGRRALDGYRVCEPCIREFRQALDDIVRIAPTLDDPRSRLPRRGSDTARSSSSYCSASPADDTVIALTDRRTIAERRGDPDDIRLVLHWAHRVRRDAGVDAELHTVVDAAQLLHRMWNWACKQDWCGLALWEVNNVAHALRDVAHENRGKAKLGRCPVTLDGLRCSYLLLVRPDADHITCPRCLTRWTRDQWIHLGNAIDAADTLEQRR